MTRREFPILPILLMCAMALGAYWLYKNVDFEEVDYDVEQSQEARTNPLLAALRLLEKEGFDFDVPKDRGVFSSLDVKTTGVLWIANLNVLANQTEVDKIHTWVGSGGTLLTSPRNTGAFEKSTVSGSYLAKLGLSALNDDELETATSQHEKTMYEGDNFYSIDLPDTKLQSNKIGLYTDNAPYFKNVTTNDVNIRDIVDTPYIVHKKIGNGYVTVYNDHSMFNNDSISFDEHGYLLLWLTQPIKNKQLSVVFQPTEKPGLFRMLWNRFTLASLLLGIVLVGFIRWASSRLGPIEHERPPIQNNLMSHLEARGEYWYRHDHTDKIVANVQFAAIDNLLKRQGQLGIKQAGDSMDKNAAIEQASKLLRCSAVTAEHALFGRVKKDSAILSASRVLQKINHRKPLKS